MPRLDDLHIRPDLVVPARLLSVRFSRSSGPGGQHVNKVATRVELLLDLDGTAGVIGQESVERIRTRLAGRLDRAGRLRIVCDRFRRQGRNLAEARARMERLVRAALVCSKRRRPTRPTAASRQRRLADKKHRSRLKQLRSERIQPD